MSGHSGPGAYDSRKRAFDVVDDFFSNAKRRQVDPASYAQVGRSLLPLHGALSLHAAGGGPLGAADYLGGPSAAAAAAALHHHHQQQQQQHQHQQQHSHHHPSAGPAGPLSQQYYLPPMPNARTKSDLIQLDHILEQMQTTVYENSSNATNGIHVHGQNTFGFRSSPSPPGANRAAAAAAVAAAAAAANGMSVMPDGYSVSGPTHMASPETVISSHGTPAVTPPSSNLSYTSGQSPTPSSSDLSPQSRPGALYPSLPAVSQVFPGHSTTPVLGANYDNNERRRYSGGMLQRARNPQPRLAPIEDVVSAPLKAAPAPASPAAPTAAESAPSPAAIGSPSASSDTSSNDSSREREEQYDQWLENMRVIEYLREYIQDRLKRNDFDESASNSDAEQKRRESSPNAMDIDREEPAADKPLYPVLRVSEN